jgi:hypothetical protein
MAFYNHRKEQLLGKQLTWKNTTHESQFSPFKNWYGIIKVEINLSLLNMKQNSDHLRRPFSLRKHGLLEES